MVGVIPFAWSLIALTILDQLTFSYEARLRCREYGHDKPLETYRFKSTEEKPRSGGLVASSYIRFKGAYHSLSINSSSHLANRKKGSLQF